MEEDGWFLLSSDEWSYLLASGRTNAADLNSLGTVNGKKGLVILPDGWVKPDGVPDFSTAYTTYGFGANTYTTAQWEIMAASGAVFLPCGGYSSGDGTTASDVDDHGTYWTSTPSTGTKAYCMRFYNGTIHDQNFDPDTTTFRSVIFVKEVPATILDEEDEAAAFATKLAAARSEDYALVHRTLRKDSTLYTLCLPFDVPNIDASPLAGAEVFEFKGGRVSGTTGSEVLQLHLSPLQGKRLTQGVPYILRWAKTSPVETLSYLYFYNVENWDENTDAATDPGNATIKFHGVYPKAHIPGYNSSSVAHYNFFIGANNTLYWPDDATYAGHNMKGFRAYFYITPGGGPSPAPAYRAMPVVWQISDQSDTTTDYDLTPTDAPQQATKIIRDGHVYILYNGLVFPL